MFEQKTLIYYLFYQYYKWNDLLEIQGVVILPFTPFGILNVTVDPLSLLSGAALESNINITGGVAAFTRNDIFFC